VRRTPCEQSRLEDCNLTLRVREAGCEETYDWKPELFHLADELPIAVFERFHGYPPPLMFVNCTAYLSDCAHKHHPFGNLIDSSSKSIAAFSPEVEKFSKFGSEGLTRLMLKSETRHKPSFW